MKFPTIDQKWVATAGVAVGGALAALAASDTVPPQVAAYAAAAVLILGMFGVHLAPNKKQEAKAADAAVAALSSSPPPSPGTPHTPWPNPSDTQK